MKTILLPGAPAVDNRDSGDLNPVEQSSPDAARLRAEQFYQDARKCYVLKRLSDALALVQKALLLHPGSAALHSLQGEIYWAQGKADLARTRFKRALQLDPDDAAAKRHLTDPPPAGRQDPAGAAPPAGREIPAQDAAPTSTVEDLTLTAMDEVLVLEEAHGVLTRLAQAELMIKANDLLKKRLLPQFSALRHGLSDKIQRAFKAHAQTGPAEGDPASRGAGPPANPVGDVSVWQDMAAFQHSLGPRGSAPGATSQGPEVQNLQQVLKQRGFSVQLSGTYDRYTLLAVRQFQERSGIKPANGIVGGETRKALNALIGKGHAV